MSVVKSALSASPEELRANRESYDGRVADLRARRAAAVAAGSEAARAALREAGQLLVRERVSALLDPGSPFLELCQLAGEGLHGDTVPGAGIVVGVGMVSGRPCMVIANDAAVHDGAYSAITGKKHVRALRFAWMHRLPCLTMVQSGGRQFLREGSGQPGAFADDGQFGSILYNQLRMSREGIAQIASVHGPAADSGAFVRRCATRWSSCATRARWPSAATRCRCPPMPTAPTARTATPTAWPRVTRMRSRSCATSSPTSATCRASAATWPRSSSRCTTPQKSTPSSAPTRASPPTTARSCCA
jgi:hypothetical protein